MKILYFALVFCILIITPSVFAEDKVPDWVRNTAGWWASDQISDTEFLNAIEFLTKEGIIQVDVRVATEKSNNVPDWVRNTAGWWAAAQISDTEFLNAIGFLIESGVINISNYSCDQNEDQDGNGVPDLIETAPVISGLSVDENIINDNTFASKNWSNCYFPKDLSHYRFIDVDLSYSDFSDSKLFNTMFEQVNLQGANLSNIDIKGSVFFLSDLSYTNFENSDFSTDNWEEPFVIFTYEVINIDQPNIIGDVSKVCYYNPCRYYLSNINYDSSGGILDATFGENNVPLNLKLIDSVFDASDKRTVWRHLTSFIGSNITETVFTGSDLSYVKFTGLDVRNVDFTDVNLNNADFIHVNFDNVKSTDNLLSGTIGSEGMTYPANTKLDTADQYISNKKFETLDDLNGSNFNIVFDSALDYPPINWSMGMTIYDKKLYVADTDNHRIVAYDLANDKKLFTFASPIQNYCESTHTWTKDIADCTNEMRNLPTSIEIINKKIFVAYGFQDEIQVFDLDGVYLWKFGSSGTKTGQFNTPHRLAALNNELFVADSKNHRIQVFDTDGNFLRQFGTHGDHVGQLNHPIDVHAYNNQIFVADLVRESILVFDLNDKFMREFEVRQNVADISQPFGVFVYADLIFVSDIGDHSVKIFELDGNFVKQFGQYGDRYGEFKHPSLAITDGSRIFVSDADNYRIQIFNIIP